MTEEAAAEAPAEAEDSTAGAREPAATDTEGQKDGVSVQQALLLDMTLGPVKLGMPSQDVRSILGTPKEESDEFYVCTDKGDYRYVTWRYNFTNDPNFISDVKLRFADVGDGFVLDEIMPRNRQTAARSLRKLPASPNTATEKRRPSAALPTHRTTCCASATKSRSWSCRSSRFASRRRRHRNT